MKERVTVIIPSYNYGNYIRMALKSVQDQRVPLKIIVIDDASTDNTEEILKEYQHMKHICYVRNKRNMGVANARNLGVKMADTEYVAFLDADDWWGEEKLKKQLKLADEKGAVFCFTGRELCRMDGRGVKKRIHVPEQVTYSSLLKTNCIACSSVLLRTEVAKAIPMDHDEFHEDYLNWLRILKRCQIAYGLDEPLLKSRLTEGGKSRNKCKSFRMTYGVYRCMGFGRARSIYFLGNHMIRSGLRYLL